MNIISLIDKKKIQDFVTSWTSETRQVILLCIVFFSITLIFSQIYPTYSDASRHLIRSQWIVTHSWFPYDEYAFDQPWFYVYPPMFHILSAASQKITGIYHIIPAASGAVSIVLTYFLVSLWYDRSIGLLTAFALALNPVFILWSSRLYVGTTITAGFLLTVFLYFKYIEHNKKIYLYLAFIIGGSLSAVKTYGPIAAGIVLFHLLWTQREQLGETLRTVSAPLAAGILVSLPWPIRNVILTGSPVPKVTGIPGGVNSVSSVEGMHILIPRLSELQLFFVRALGVWPPQAVTDYLGKIHPILPILWFLLPGTILLIMIIGIRKNQINSIILIWITAFILLYLIQRVASSGATAFKYRHFIHLTPMFCLLFILGYQKITINNRVKRIASVVLIIALLTQMGALAAFQTEKMETTFEPASNWIEDNIQHDEVIYMPNFHSELAHRVDDKYKFITISSKDKYINSSENFTEVVPYRADWIISYEEAGNIEKDRIEAALTANKIEHAKTISIKKSVSVGSIKIKTATFDRTWYIYRVLDDPKHSNESRNSI